ncbi:EpsG family protein [Cloacibacillus porcorum]|uniref:EpsG family protein n=1 Tax=Cloacibacillus porcorum TaxID=1197717 RepID=A0A1B2I8R5_9BACT|nr:EpsG family protein [Cloacibacillus porcorum]ANZ46342.1 hypothetical protein BED41_15235 [Cloacibacillus porcorum]
MFVALNYSVLFIAFLCIDKITKYKYMLSYIFLAICCIILMAANFYNADYAGYEMFYYNNTDYGEFFYQELARYFSSHGFSYQKFKLITSILFLLNLFYIISLLVPKTIRTYVLGLYMMFPFFFDVIVVRNFMGNIFFMYAFVFFISEKKYKYYASFFFMALAIGFHSLYIIYLPFFLIPFIKSCQLLRRILYILIIIAFVIAVGGDIIKILSPLLLSYSNNLKIVRVLLYEARAKAGVMIFLFFTFTPLFFIWKYWKFYTRTQRKPKYSKFQYLSTNFLPYVYYANIILLLYLPLIVLQSNFYRIYANIAILNSIALLMAATDKHYYFRKATCIGIGSIYILRACMSLYVYKDVFSHNYIISYLL